MNSQDCAKNIHLTPKRRKRLPITKRRSVNLKDWLNCQFSIAKKYLFSWVTAACTMKVILTPFLFLANVRLISSMPSSYWKSCNVCKPEA